jgi:AmmeMemoRadiSam system protein A
MTGSQPPLGEDERRALLHLARGAIVARLENLSPPDWPRDLPRLVRPQAAFVTLRTGSELRGCIGSLDPHAALADNVIRCAAAAATEDSRFAPLEASEAAGLRIEISVLGPLAKVRAPLEEIVPGRHGLVIASGSRRGLLLPQVAAEQGWDARTFLGETCRKAGLPPDAWERGATVQAFEAEVFGEE